MRGASGDGQTERHNQVTGGGDKNDEVVDLG